MSPTSPAVHAASAKARRTIAEIRDEFHRRNAAEAAACAAKLNRIRAEGQYAMSMVGRRAPEPEVVAMAEKLAPWPYPLEPVAPAADRWGWLRKLVPAALAALIAGGVASNANDAISFINSNWAGPSAPLDIKPGGALKASSAFIGGRLKCAENVNAMLRANGYRGTGSAMARSFLAYGKGISGPRPGAIQVERRGSNPRAGHVQIVSHQQNGVWMCKNPSSRVGRWTMQPCANPRVLAYRMPTIADVDTSRAYAAARTRTFGTAPLAASTFSVANLDLR